MLLIITLRLVHFLLQFISVWFSSPNGTNLLLTFVRFQSSDEPYFVDTYSLWLSKEQNKIFYGLFSEILVIVQSHSVERWKINIDAVLWHHTSAGVKVAC